MRLIDADALSEAMYHEVFETDAPVRWDGGCWIRYKMFENAIENAPTIKPSLYGYDLEHLKLIAHMLQKENLTPERVSEALTDFGRMALIIKAEFKERFEEALRKEAINGVFE